MYLGLSITKPNIYGGNFIEPPIESGYSRVRQPRMVMIPIIGFAQNIDEIYFPEAHGNGYGEVSHLGFFESEWSDIPVCIVELNETVDVPAGALPVFKIGDLKFYSIIKIIIEQEVKDGQ